MGRITETRCRSYCYYGNGHADLNLHFTVMQIRTDATCHLCQDDE